MATIDVDGTKFEVEDGENLLHAVLSEQLDLPYFCWHPAMGSVGACRQCAVIQYADENDERGRLAMACMTNVADGMRISIKAPHASDFRESVIEWLMENHPHDCPVCEEGGECHLQDMTVMTGHSVRRYTGKKRTWENQNLGPFIGHEMNRCITCYRCVRYYRDYAGGTDLTALGSRSRMYFGRVEDGTLESEFSGNLVEVCPTGVFTDKPFSKHYSRKWDLQSAPSICPGCSVGCNIIPSERYGVLKRVHNRYNSEVNSYFLCDRGRFGSPHFVNSEKRIKQSGIRATDGVFEVRGSQAAIAAAGKVIDDRTIGIGSPRASLESNYALKALVGAENFCTGLSDNESEMIDLSLSIYGEGVARIPSVKDVESADAILILGEDVMNSAARVALAVRQAVRGVSFEMARDAAIPAWQDAGVRGHAQGAKSPLMIASVTSTRLDDIASATYSGSPGDLIRLGNEISAYIDSEKKPEDEFVSNAVRTLSQATKPLVITGMTCGNSDILRVASNIARALKSKGNDPALLIAGSEANSFGAGLLGGDLSMTDALTTLSQGGSGIVLENDLYRRANRESVDDALLNGSLVALDVLENETNEKVDVVLPAASYAETTGTFVNYETRAQRFYQVFDPDEQVLPSWRWLTDISEARGKLGYTNVNELIDAVSTVDGLKSINTIAPGADYRVEGQSKIPRQTHRYSGRTAMRANQSVHEPKTPVDEETPFSFSMEGQNLGHQDGATVPYVWTPGWNSNQSVFKFQEEIGGPLHGGDPGIRLINPTEISGSAFSVSPEEIAEGSGESFQSVPVRAIFGSDELTGESWPIQQRTPAPFVVMNPLDAKKLNVVEGGGVTSKSIPESIEVRLDHRVKEGVVGVSTGIGGIMAPVGDIDIVADPGFVRRPGGDPNVIAKG